MRYGGSDRVGRSLGRTYTDPRLAAKRPSLPIVLRLIQARSPGRSIAEASLDSQNLSQKEKLATGKPLTDICWPETTETIPFMERPTMCSSMLPNRGNFEFFKWSK